MAVRHVEPYTDEWQRQPRCYVKQVVEVLDAEVAEWWEGPGEPRAATVLVTGGSALVWDEESGWRLGRFLSGARGEHTELADVRYLGGGLLPRPERVPAALEDARLGIGASSAWRPCYRSHRNCRDGFDVALDFWSGLVRA
ncbi:DUF6292 family protein [Nonomuraea endophytica]|uniref:DUF6292 domain-containing protein n=1 Tax=Nonomuraea endophytica TaxID=714136 RepID=A0A7W8A721_9ACTN|nr:DUF6292 family protein [Nonomuraea endophytica]MBB5080807.1 hypothetical protein [Nonomuraea endophytica]